MVKKWFLFGAYEYTDLHGQGVPTPLLAPTSGGLSLLQSLAIDQNVKDVLANYPVAPANDAGFQTVNGQNIPIGNLVIISPQLQHEHDAQVNTDYTRGNHQYAARFLFNHSQFILPTNSTRNSSTRSRRTTAARFPCRIPGRSTAAGSTIFDWAIRFSIRTTPTPVPLVLRTSPS